MMRARGLILTVLAATLGLLACSAVPTLAAAPEAPVTEPATGVTATTAVLNGELNPTTTAVVGWHFAYSTEASCTSLFVTPWEPEAEVHAQKVNTEVAELEPNKTYAFCLVATNAAGESTVGGQLSFTTQALKPGVDGESDSGVTSNDAFLEAFVNANNEETTYSFAYATNEALTGAVTVPGGVLPAVYGDQPANADIGGTLAPDTTYYYRVIAENAAGTTEGAVQSFRTTAPPLLTIGEAQSITRTTATLSGTVDPAGLETFYYYQYGTSTSYGGNAPSIQGVSAGLGFGAVAAPIGISGLVPATTYHYRLVASNADGPTESPDKTFTTAPPTPPTASTGEASNVTLTTASVAGTINPEGLETSYELDLGSDTTYGTSIYGEAGSGSTPTEITVGLQNLAPGSTYHYRMVAINSDGRTYGTDRTFTTPAYGNPIVQPPGLPLLQTPAIAFPTETVTGKHKVKTRAQLLAAALEACHKKHDKARRKACEKAAQKRYGPLKKKHKQKK